jgi:predicted DNA-binding transcriptional regulator AlpA
MDFNLTPAPASNPPAEPSNFLPDTEAAGHLKISKSFLRKLVGQGILPKPIKLGRRALWSRSALNAAMAKLERIR